MGIDASIPLSVRPVALENPQDIQARGQQLRALYRQNTQADQDEADKKTLADLYRNNIDASGAVNHQGVVQGMAKSGLGDKIPAYMKSVAEAQTASANLAHTQAQTGEVDLNTHLKKLGVVNNAFSALLSNPQITQNDVIGSISNLVDNGVIDASQGAQMARMIPGKPEQLRSFLTQKSLETMDAEKQIQTRIAMAPKYNEQDTGGAINEGTVNPLTGQRTAGPVTVAKTPTPAERVTAANTHIPAGYEPDPAKPGAVRPIVGGPKDPDASTGMDSRSSVMFNRVASSAQAAVKAISNIAELPITTSSGIFGTAEPGHSLFSSVKNVLAQKVTGQEAQDFKTMVAGVSRNLSTIETAGLAPNGAITNSMNAVLLGEGDTQMTKLRKMAEMRQIVEENLKPQLANPKLAPAQKQLVRDIIGSVQQAVPFTHHDITLLQRSTNPKATIMDFATQQGLPAAKTVSFNDLPP